jgi:hypothetical protein
MRGFITRRSSPAHVPPDAHEDGGSRPQQRQNGENQDDVQEQHETQLA